MKDFNIKTSQTYFINGHEEKKDEEMLLKVSKYKLEQCIVLFTVVLCLAILGLIPHIFAEEGQIDISTPQSVKGKCIENFDIYNINFQDPKVIKNLKLLTEYFQCKAAFNRSNGYCDNLRSLKNLRDDCKTYFNDYSVMQIENILSTNPDISECDKVNSVDAKRYKDCKALISGDSAFCNSNTCRNKVLYIKAVKTRNVKVCNQIKDGLAKAICQGRIYSNEDMCEENSSFKEFRRRYCDDLN